MIPQSEINIEMKRKIIELERKAEIIEKELQAIKFENQGIENLRIWIYRDIDGYEAEAFTSGNCLEKEYRSQIAIDYDGSKFSDKNLELNSNIEKTSLQLKSDVFSISHSLLITFHSPFQQGKRSCHEGNNKQQDILK